MRRIWPGISMGAAVVVAVWLRYRLLDTWRMTFDEAFSWKLVHDFDALELVRRTAADVHPPLYYLILKGWTALFGDSLATLRLPSLLAGIAIIPGTYLLASEMFRLDDLRLHGRRKAAEISTLAQWTAWMAATAAGLIGIAADARMYSLGTLLFVLGSWTLLRAMQAPQTRGWWIALVILNTAFLYTHNYALLFVTGQTAFVLLWATRRRWTTPARVVVPGQTAACRATALPFVFFSPWLWIVLQQSGRVRESYWISSVTPADALMLWYELFYPRVTPAGPTYHAWPLVVLFSAAIIGLLLWLVKYSPRLFELVAATVCLPTLLAILVSLTVAPILVPRYLVFGMPILFAGIVGALAGALRNRTALAAAALVFVINNVQASSAVDEGRGKIAECGAARAAEHLKQELLAGKTVVVMSPELFLRIKFYTREWGRVRLAWPPAQIAHFEGHPVLADEDFLPDPELLDVGSSRLVLVSWPVAMHTSSRQMHAFLEVWSPTGSRRSFADSNLAHHVYITEYARRRVAAAEHVATGGS